MHACMRKEKPPHNEQPAGLTSNIKGAAAVQDRQGSTQTQGKRQCEGRQGNQAG